MKTALLLTSLNFFLLCTASAQSVVSLAGKKPGSFDHVKIEKLSTSPESTSFLIWVKEKVKPHKHLKHTEQVYILEGRGLMQLGDKKMEVRAGDLITIPPNTVHAVQVSSREPMKVLSVQSPEFFGKDRVWVEE